MLGRDFEDEVWLRFVFELVIWPNRLLWKDELNPRVCCAFGNVSVPAQNIFVFINEQRGWHNTACKYCLKIYMYWILTSYISYKYRHLPMYRANLVMRSCASSKVQCNLCRHFRLSSPVVIGFSSNFLRHNSIKWQNLLWCFFCCKTLSLYCESEYLDSTEWSVDLVLLQKAINHFLPLCLKMI